MKKIAVLALCSLTLWACNNTTENTEEKTTVAESKQEVAYNFYGDSISTSGAVSVNQLLDQMKANDSMQVKVSGTVNSSCKMKGCWMKMDLGNGKEMHVTFKDYEFFVPKDLNGEEVIVEGYARIDTLDVDYLRHLAHDAGKSEEEIAEITEPEVSITYEATGVAIKKES